MPQSDVIIVGAGASGLLLCQQLLSRPRLADLRITVIDHDADGIDDRWWAYWSSEHRPVDATACVDWQQLRLHTGTTTQVVDIAPYSYRLILGTDLRRWVLSTPGAERVEWIADRVVNIEHAPHANTVSGRAGSYQAVIVFDSRHPSQPVGDGRFLQFLGWQITVPRNAFDQSVATFMDFAVPSPHGVSFGYVLPRTPTSAIVELAQFVTNPQDSQLLSKRLSEYLDRQWGLTEWIVRGQECAVVSLSSDPPPRSRRALAQAHAPDPPQTVVPIGRRAGLIRPSTGYAFEQMIRDAHRLADDLERTGHPTRRPAHRRRHAFLDRVFCQVMADDPATIEAAIGSLFLNNPAPSVLRFLDQDSTKRQEARIIASMPKAPFLTAGIRASLPR